MSIHYSKLTGFHDLFLDYLYKFENVKKFFHHDFSDVNLYADMFEKIVSAEKDHKEELTTVLLKQYENYSISDETEFNIKSLALTNTLAIVTGQQAGFCAGPLYTIYKTITAIKLAEKLKKNYPEYNFVPVFWMEIDDHDFDEISSLNMLGSNNEVVHLTYKDHQEETVRSSISKITLDKEIDAFINSVSENLRDTDYKEEIVKLLSFAYTDGKRISDAFKELLISLFDKYGLVIADPSDPAIKEILKPLFVHEIENFQANSDVMLARSAELEEVYHAQVKVKPINLFMEDEDGGRYLIDPVENEFRLKGKRKRISKEDLLNQLDKSPQKFSPNVLLRPICQDYLFPTAFYIAGPSEISYFAQVNCIYPLFNVEQPFIYPRASATVIEKQISNLLDKYDLGLADLLNDEQLLKNKIVNAASAVDIDNLFGESEKVLELLAEKISEELVTIDKSLSDAVNKSLDKMNQALHNLKVRSESANERNNFTTIRQLEKIRNNLYPGANYQERVFNWTHFANKYGFDFINWLFDELSIEDRNHQILEL
jgi:bacillithiol biosynthesis cysteine-adding enzyme BshC